MNKFTFLIILFLLFISPTAFAQNFPVTCITGGYSLFNTPYEKMNGYSISLQHEFGITKRISLFADATFHDFKKYEDYDVDTITPLYFNQTGNGRFYNSTSVRRFLSLPLSFNYSILRTKKQTISFGVGTVLQYELANKYNFSYYTANPDGTFNMGPEYGSYEKTSEYKGIIPDYFHITAIARATRTITSNFGISAHFRSMFQIDKNDMAHNKFFDFALGVFIKTGKNFKKK